MAGTSSAELEHTVDACLALLGSQAETLAARPHSTVTPAGHGGDLATLAQALAADRLSIEEKIAEGGMGVVHLATQTALGRKVAVKMLREDARDEDSMRDLLREATITGALEHPNVLPVYDAHLGPDGSPRIVLKRIEGQPWSEILHDADVVRGGGDLLEHNLRVLMQVCHAAHFAHSRGIVHRDLKPDNVMIGAFGEVYLLDWGIALKLGEKNGNAQLAGTPAYMAPEMVRPELGSITPRTDVYLLGGILYEILCRKPPHAAPSAQAMIRSILLSQPKLPDSAPEELVAIARRALHAEAAERYESAEAFRLALQGFIDHRGSLRLGREAERALSELEDALGATDSPTRRASLARAFGACRFGFGEALRMWPDNALAREGLTCALTLMIEHEATQGDAEAAAALLSELPHLPADLEARVAEARRQQAAARLRLAKLERLERMFDPRTEIQARWAVTSALALLGTVIPLTTQSLVDPRSESYGPLFVLPGLFLAVALTGAWWKRHAISHTGYNRWVFATVIAALAGQLLVHAGCALLSIPVVSSMAMAALLWSVLVGMLAAATDRRVVFVSLGYLAVFLAIALIADNRRHANLLMSLGHAVTTTTVFLIWRPQGR